MAIDQPLYTTTANSGEHIRAISDAILLITNDSTPFLDAYGVTGLNSKFDIVNVTNKKIEWITDELRPTSATITAIANGTDTTVTVSDASEFKVGDIWKTATTGEWLRVESIDSATTITVTRSVGTVAAAADAGTTLTYISDSAKEGADAEYGTITDRAVTFNYTQILSDAVKVSGTMQVTDQYGVSGTELDSQVRKKVRELWRALERMVFYSNHRDEVSGSGGPYRIMGGLPYFITTNTNSGSLTQANIENLMRDATNATGEAPNEIWMHPNVLLTFKNLYDSSSFLRVQRGETTIGMQITDFLTPYGTASLRSSIHCPTDKVFILNSNHVAMETLRGWMEMDLPRNGDYESRQVLGEFTLGVRNEQAHAVFTIS